MIKKAEKNCVRIAKDLSDMIFVLDSFASFGNKFFAPYHEEHNSFFEGLTLMRNATYRRYIEMIANCFTLVGVGGGDALEYSKEKFNERFGDKGYEIMSLLDRYGQIPSHYKTADEKAFREEANAKHS